MILKSNILTTTVLVLIMIKMFELTKSLTRFLSNIPMTTWHELSAAVESDTKKYNMGTATIYYFRNNP